MHRVNSIHHVPSIVLDAWKEKWTTKDGFHMACGRSYYYVAGNNKYDMWVWARSDAPSPRLRGRINLRKDN